MSGHCLFLHPQTLCAKPEPGFRGASSSSPSFFPAGPVYCRRLISIPKSYAKAAANVNPTESPGSTPAAALPKLCEMRGYFLGPRGSQKGPNTPPPLPVRGEARGSPPLPGTGGTTSPAAAGGGGEGRGGGPSTPGQAAAAAAQSVRRGRRCGAIKRRRVRSCELSVGGSCPLPPSAGNGSAGWERAARAFPAVAPRGGGLVAPPCAALPGAEL